MSIQMASIHHRFGQHLALTDVSLQLEDGEILCVIGPSGSGKSTLLRIAAGLEALQQGKITLDGRHLADPSNSPPPEQRSVGLVFQDHALFPHLSVTENVAFGLDHLTTDQRDKTVNELLARVGLVELAHRYPHTLSGGQQQRIALIRALATQPRVMLLDEPFASVDTPLRRQLRQDARLGLKQSGTTTIMVTHDPEEAMAMADRILVLVDGVPVQLDTPQALWRSPAHPFIAESIADMQSIRGQVSDKCIVTAFGSLPLAGVTNAADLTPGQMVTLGVRNHCAASDSPTSSESNTCVVVDLRFDDGKWVALARSGDQQLRVVFHDKPYLQTGDPIALNFTDVEAVAYN